MESSGALRFFVAVAREGSFSSGAAACAAPQSTVSRKIAALEAELGGRLFNRTTRVVTLTAFGSAVFAAATDLLTAESDFRDRVSAALAGELRVLLPAGPTDGEIAALAVRARARGLAVSLSISSLTDRRNALHSRAVEGAIVPSASDDAHWTAELGLASSGGDPSTRLMLATLRPHRSETQDTWPSIVLLPDDADSGVRAILEEQATSSGLASGQVRASRGVSEALEIVLAGEGWLCCTRTEARRWNLDWQAISDASLTRPLRLECSDADQRTRLLKALAPDLDALYTDAHPVRSQKR